MSDEFKLPSAAEVLQGRFIESVVALRRTFAQRFESAEGRSMWLLPNEFSRLAVGTFCNEVDRLTGALYYNRREIAGVVAPVVLETVTYIIDSAYESIKQWWDIKKYEDGKESRDEENFRLRSITSLYTVFYTIFMALGIVKFPDAFSEMVEFKKYHVDGGKFTEVAYCLNYSMFEFSQKLASLYAEKEEEDRLTKQDSEQDRIIQARIESSGQKQWGTW